MNFLNEDDLKNLLQYLKNADDMTHTSLIWTIALTGMRKGEAAALHWKDINLKEGTINIYETRDYLGQREAKTKNSIRLVEIDKNLCSLLDAYRKKVIEKKLEKGIQHSINDHVFVNLITLRPIGRGLAGTILNKAFENKIISKKITPHGLRHTYATIMCARGVPIPIVAKMIGDTPNTVIEYYAHSMKDKEKEAVQILSKVLF
ncbi:site-specific integrase [Lysinibacillus sp. NPDC056959]|uniref:site-specific integrase n=1 Tax=Lysinibacillus sp. NPDC056959 TaxID=3345981 RepID=UPI00363E7A03